MHNSSVCLTNYPSTQRVTLNNVPRSSFHLISWNVGPSPPPHPPHLGQISDTIGQPGKKTWFPACLRHNYIFDPADQHFLQNLLRKQQTIFMTASFNNTTTNRCHWDNGLIAMTTFIPQCNWLHHNMEFFFTELSFLPSAHTKMCTMWIEETWNRIQEKEKIFIQPTINSNLFNTLILNFK